jgi:magnesium chelatase subunit D
MSLRPPPAAAGDRRPGRGPVIDVERATDLHDLALTSTLFEAAKFQSLRRARGGCPEGILPLRPEDLRCYRRAHLPESLLVLVLDYTCLRGRDWGAALRPYLHQAYVGRAGVHLVQVGAGGDRGLRARLLKARNLLAPELARALAAPPGEATPLAHGLELALQTMRHALQHGRSPAARCSLVVLSDGRGNVPLAASHAGLPPAGRVGREGVEDALAQARLIAALDRVRAVVLDPRPQQLPELPGQLAAALGAMVHALPAAADGEDEP